MNNPPPLAILRLGEGASSVAACHRPTGGFAKPGASAKPQYDKQSVHLQKICQLRCKAAFARSIAATSSAVLIGLLM